MRKSQTEKPNLSHVKIRSYRSKRWQRLLPYIIIAILSAFILIDKCRAEEPACVFLVENNRFTNQNYTRQDLLDFFELFPENRFTDWQKEFVYKQSRYWRLHPITVLAMAQKEGGVVVYPPEDPAEYERWINLCMGYGMEYQRKVNDEVFYQFYGFDVQVNRGARCLRKFFDRYTTNKTVYMHNTKERVQPENAATYALYIYTPFMGEYTWYGKTYAGQEEFVKIYDKMWKLWNEHIPGVRVAGIRIDFWRAD